MVLITDNNEKFPINKSDFSVDLNGEQLKFDVCFNIIHGTPGENGILQAYWDAVGQKYTGCNFYQSALTFNKKTHLLYCLNTESLPQKVFTSEKVKTLIITKLSAHWDYLFCKA